MQLVSGRDIDLTQYPTDSNAIILNESAVKSMGFKEPIGQIIKDNGNDWTVVGVVKDFILTSPYHPTNPMVIEGAKGWFNVINIKLNNEHSTSGNLAKMESVFKKYNPDFPFEIKFVDESYARKFDSEKRTGTLAALFAGLTIFISCLGLFGLATYMAENRIKEIGIRKVLGASMSDITALLSKDFLLLVLIALVIAIPAAWWAMHTWLESYPYRTTISVWVFVAAGVLSLLITMLTVSSQAIKAAISNPVKSLRTE
jgi:ABC-type antimicrobial peptide transport system permease subunit